MEQEKLNLFVEILKEKREITFRLYNAIYIIRYKDKKYIINQVGIDTNYVYDNISLLFDNYLIYGNTLREVFDDIKIVG